MGQPSEVPSPGSDPFPLVEPNTSTPKTIGILNIVFASLLMLCGGCYGIQLIAQSAMAPLVEAQQQQAQVMIEAEHKDEIRKLEEQAKAALTKEEKEALQSQIKAKQAQPVPKIPNISKYSREPHLIGYYAADLGSGLILNFLMLIAGVGLIRFREWGRILGMWVAGFKVLRLIVLYTVFIMVLVPVFAKMMLEMFDEIAQGAPAAGMPPAAQMATMMGTWFSVAAIAMIVLGSIYPAIALWLLSRPRTKAACVYQSQLNDQGYE
jgi:hypothetical protein